MRMPPRLTFQDICRPMSSLPLSPYDLMQMTVDAANGSAHSTNKIAATLVGKKPDGSLFVISKTNEWPRIIETKLGQEARIGDSSGTVHAEPASILEALSFGFTTKGAHLYITDPFCPNCAKNIAEAGVAAIYLDQSGFSKDFAERRGDHFRSMSLEICEKAGIPVYEVNRKAQTIHRIYEPGEGYVPPEDNPAEILPLPFGGWQALIAQKTEECGTQNFALAPVMDHAGRLFALFALPHLAMGYTNANPPNFHESTDQKYNFMIGPTNRLLMQAARRGLFLKKDDIYTVRVPTARELVNLVGAGVTRITIGDRSASRDESGLVALDILTKAGILTVSEAASPLCEISPP